MFEGSRLREQREILGLSQELLAEKVNVHVNTIRRWEKGKQVPDIDKLNRLAEALGTTVAYLSGETSEAVLQKGTLRKPPAPDDSETKENRLIIRNNDMYVNLPETSEGFDVLRRFLDMQAAKNPVMKPATVQA